MNKKLNNCYVYKHTCKINNKSYIGWCNRNPKYRWGKNGNNYLVKTITGNYTHKKFANAILKYGWDNFTHEILCSNLTYQEVIRKEQELIEKYDSFYNGYNSTLGGEGSLGRMHNINVKNIISNKKLINGKMIYCYNKNGELICAMKGYRKIAEYLNLPVGGIVDCCIKVKDQHNSHKTAYGYVFSNIELTKIEIKKRYESYNKKFDNIYWYDKNGNLLAIYDSYNEAMIKTNINRTQISNCCHNHLKTCHNTIFSFKELTKEEIINRFKKGFNNENNNL